MRRFRKKDRSRPLESLFAVKDQPSEEIEYVGRTGLTQSCLDGLLLFLQCDEPIVEAKLITRERSHGFILHTEERKTTVVVRAGFASGYTGEGPAGLAYALSLLEEFNVSVDELEVPQRLFDRFNRGQLTQKDMEDLERMHPVRPSRIYDFIFDHRRIEALVEKHLPLPIPRRLIDARIRDLSADFWKDPNARIMQGFTRLEDAVRTRCSSDEHGAKLFQIAFMGKDSVLTWAGLPQAEQAARADFFRSAYGSFRNPRAHKERHHSPEDLLSEFMTLNHLFRLEASSTIRILDQQSPLEEDSGD